jgi:hypothetical protein
MSFEGCSSGEALNKYENQKRPQTAAMLVPEGIGIEQERRTNTQTGILPTEVESAMCVQRFDDSLSLQFALHIAFRCVLHRCESQDIHR